MGTEALPNQKRGTFQTWNKGNKPWVLVYSSNTIKNIKFGVKIPAINGFYLPNIDDDDYLIDLDSCTYVNVTYAASFRYKRNNGTTASAEKYHPLTPPNDFTPENISVHPVVVVKNLNGLTIVD